MVPVMMKGRSVTVATMALGSMCRNMITRFDTPKRPGRPDIFEVPGAQEFCPDHAHKRGPAEEDRGQEDQQPETSPQNREHDDDDVELRALKRRRSR